MLPAKDNIMTTNSSIKKAIRLRMAETGEPYMVARRALSNSGNSFSRPKKGKVLTVIGCENPTDTAVFSALFAGTVSRLGLESDEKYSVLIVDLDIQNSFISTVLDLEEETLSRIGEVVTDLSLGVDIFTSVDNLFNKKTLAMFKKKYDFIILNAPSDRFNPVLDSACNNSDQIILLSSPTITGLKSLEKTVTFLSSPAEESGLGIPVRKIGLVANKVMETRKINMDKDSFMKAASGASFLGQIEESEKEITTNLNNKILFNLLENPKFKDGYRKIVTACIPEVFTTNQGEKEMNWNEFLLGYDNNGEEVTWNCSRFGNIFIGGLSGSGKTVLESTVLKQVLALDEWDVAYIDLKKVDSVRYTGSIEGSWISTDLDSALTILKNLAKTVDSRLGQINLENVATFEYLKAKESPTLLVIDELYPLLSNKEDSPIKIEIGRLLEFVIINGVRAGVYVMAATQKPEDENISISMRQNFDTRVALNGMSEIMSDWSLGGFKEASTLPYVPEAQGTGYMRTGNNLTLFKTTVL